MREVKEDAGLALGHRGSARGHRSAALHPEAQVSCSHQWVKYSWCNFCFCDKCGEAGWRV